MSTTKLWDRLELFTRAALAFVGVSAWSVIAWYTAQWNAIMCIITLVVGLIAYFIFLFKMLLYSLRPIELVKDIEQELSEGTAGAFTLVGHPLIFCMAFVISSLCMSRIWGDALFTGNQESPVNWLLYLADNLIRAACMDFAETYYLDISSIDHTQNILVCTYVLSFRTAISIGLVSVVLRTWKKLKGKPNKPTGGDA